MLIIQLTKEVSVTNMYTLWKKSKLAKLLIRLSKVFNICSKEYLFCQQTVLNL